jgi:uncharacterized protein YjbI with pentapeptide repeats
LFGKLLKSYTYLYSIQKFFWLRVINAVFISYLIVVTISYFESCHHPDPGYKCFSKQLFGVITVSNIEGFGILTASILYIFESSIRKKREHYEAWQVIDRAFAAQVPHSIARIEALQDLCKDGVTLRGIFLPEGSDLDNILLPGSDIQKANLPGVSLLYANLRAANLSGTNLQHSVLKFANLRNSNLQGSNLQDSILSGANLSYADLSYTNLENTQLSGEGIEDLDLDLDRDLNEFRSILCLSDNLSSNSRLLPDLSANNWQCQTNEAESLTEEIVNLSDLHNLRDLLVVITNDADFKVIASLYKISNDVFYAPEEIAQIKLTQGRHYDYYHWRKSYLRALLHDPNLKILGLGANLNGARLSHANLRRADSRGVNFCNADLSHADLSGANLRGANFTGANLQGAVYSATTQFSPSFNPHLDGMILSW